MSSEFYIHEDIRKLIKQTIARQNLSNVTDIKYENGAEIGAGFFSETIIATIITDKRIFPAFIKRGLPITCTKMPTEKMYQNEVYFYKEIFPTFSNFCKQKRIDNYFQNVPACYGMYGNVLALENLKLKNFKHFDRSKFMNGDHLEIVLKTLAKFHAVSYAFKDQEKEMYDALMEKVYDYNCAHMDVYGYDTITANSMKSFFSKLDIIEDKNVVEMSPRLIKSIVESITSAKKNLNEFSVLNHGDVNCSNIMFTYGEGNSDTPIDIMLIDWQLIRPASPVFDLAFFLLTITSKEVLDNLEYYLNFYHRELSKSIKSLGSDPMTSYPYEIFKNEWSQHCKYGVAMAFIAVRTFLANKDELYNPSTLDFDSWKDSDQQLIPKLEREDEFITRMKMLLDYLIKNKFV